MNNKRRRIHDFITSVQFMEKGLQKWQQTTIQASSEKNTVHTSKLFWRMILHRKKDPRDCMDSTLSRSFTVSSWLGSSLL